MVVGFFGEGFLSIDCGLVAGFFGTDLTGFSGTGFLVDDLGDEKSSVGDLDGFFGEYAVFGFPTTAGVVSRSGEGDLEENDLAFLIGDVVDGLCSLNAGELYDDGLGLVFSEGTAVGDFVDNRCFLIGGELLTDFVDGFISLNGEGDLDELGFDFLAGELDKDLLLLVLLKLGGDGDLVGALIGEPDGEEVNDEGRDFLIADPLVGLSVALIGEADGDLDARLIILSGEREGDSLDDLNVLTAAGELDGDLTEGDVILAGEVDVDFGMVLSGEPPPPPPVEDGFCFLAGDVEGDGVLDDDVFSGFSALDGDEDLILLAGDFELDDGDDLLGSNTTGDVDDDLIESLIFFLIGTS